MIPDSVEPRLESLYPAFLTGINLQHHSIVDSYKYRKVSNIRRTKSPNLNVSRLVLQLSLPNPMKPDVKSRMKM